MERVPNNTEIRDELEFLLTNIVQIRVKLKEVGDIGLLNSLSDITHTVISHLDIYKGELK